MTLKYSWIKTKRTSIFVIGAALLLLGVRSLWDVSAAQGVELNPSSAPIPRTLFGLHIHHTVSGAPTPTPWPSIPFGTWRLWDAYVTWFNLEPEKGKWDFAHLDAYVTMAEQHGVSVLLPLAMSPTWASSDTEGPLQGHPAPPKSMAEWQNYVRTVATRYKGRIHYYEIWNEPNVKGFYIGSIPEMVRLVRVASATLKQVDPSSVVVSPAATGPGGVPWLEGFLKAGGGKYVDVIGYHFYVSPRPPEAMVPLIEKVQQVMAQNDVGNKPLWDTETGWFIQDSAGSVKSPNPSWPVLSLEQASGYVVRAYILAWASGVSRLYWYSWDNWKEGLVEPDGKTLKAPGVAYEQVEQWLVGAKMSACGSSSAGIWVCRISRPGNYLARIVWRPDHKGNFLIPADWNVKEVRELNGASYVPPRNRVVSIGPSPILLVSPGT